MSLKCRLRLYDFITTSFHSCNGATDVFGRMGWGNTGKYRCNSACSRESCTCRASASHLSTGILCPILENTWRRRGNSSAHLVRPVVDRVGIVWVWKKLRILVPTYSVSMSPFTGVAHRVCWHDVRASHKFGLWWRLAEQWPGQWERFIIKATDDGEPSRYPCPQSSNRDSGWSGLRLPIKRLPSHHCTLSSEVFFKIKLFYFGILWPNKYFFW